MNQDTNADKRNQPEVWEKQRYDVFGDGDRIKYRILAPSRLDDFVAEYLTEADADRILADHRLAALMSEVEDEIKQLLVVITERAEHDRNCYRYQYGISHTSADQCDCGLWEEISGAEAFLARIQNRGES